MAVTQACGTACLVPGRRQRVRRPDGRAAPDRRTAARHPAGHAGRPGRRRQDPGALRAAAAAAGRYPDGVCLVELSALRDPELLPHTVAAHARAAGAVPRLAARRAARPPARPAPAADPRHVRAHHRRRRGASPRRSSLEAPYVTVLATSREPLDVDGETTVPVRPLPVPGPRGTAKTRTVRLDGSRARRPRQRRADAPSATRSSSSHGGPPPSCPGSRSPTRTGPT